MPDAGLPVSTPARRWIGRLIRAGLVVLAIAVVGFWIGRHTWASKGAAKVRVQRAEVTDQSLGPGDLRVYNVDSTVDLVLHGDRVLAGLSPRTADRIREKMQSEASRDTTGLGGFIAATVKQTVASAITTHVVYPVADIADMRYQDGSLVIERRDGGTTHLFGNTKVNDRNVSKSFRREDAERFIAAVRARQNQLGMRRP